LYFNKNQSLEVIFRFVPLLCKVIPGFQPGLQFSLPVRMSFLIAMPHLHIKDVGNRKQKTRRYRGMMSRFLFTNLWSDDLGLPMRTVPIARVLQEMGHDVFFCNPAASPGKIINEAELKNIIPELHHFPTVFAPATNEVWDINHFSALTGNLDETFLKDCVNAILKVVKDHDIEVMVDSWNQAACVAARILKKPLVTIIQADMHPANKGFIWWKEKPAHLPDPTPVFNKILVSRKLKPIKTSAELFRGGLVLCVGSPETDPIPPGEGVVHIGPIFYERSSRGLPRFFDDINPEIPLIWVYSGNPEYGGVVSWADSAIVLKTAIEALAKEEVQVVMTTGYHDLPERLSPLPDNFRYEAFIPGLALANRCDLIIHHGGHGSCMTGAYTGTPAVIIPTYSERESNARRMAQLGVAEILVPKNYASGDKRLSSRILLEIVQKVLSDESYRVKARILGQKMKCFGGAKQAAHLIMEFAETLKPHFS
jgi:UDP:flavonoid glycosyltransferase YjiC (YdhE family)